MVHLADGFFLPSAERPTNNATPANAALTHIRNGVVATSNDKGAIRNQGAIHVTAPS